MEFFNILVLGAPKIGKKTFIKNCRKYFKNDDYDVTIPTNYGEFNFRFYASTEIGDYIRLYDAVIIIYDSSDSMLYLQKKLPNIPIMLCENNMGTPNLPELSNNLCKKLGKTHDKIFEFQINTKNGHHCKKPLVQILKVIKKQDDLIIDKNLMEVVTVNIPREIYEKIKRICGTDGHNLTLGEMLQFHDEMKSIF